MHNTDVCVWGGGGGGAVKFYTYKKGGGGRKSLIHPEGGHNKFLSSFTTGT